VWSAIIERRDDHNRDSESAESRPDRPGPIIGHRARFHFSGVDTIYLDKSPDGAQIGILK
jgi:hypothetical protein